MNELLCIKIAMAAIDACRAAQAQILAAGPSVIGQAQVEAIQVALVAVLEALVELRDAEPRRLPKQRQARPGAKLICSSLRPGRE